MKWLLPLLGFLLLAPWTPELDQACALFFYTPSPWGKGCFYTNAFFDFLFIHGEHFGLGVGGLAACLGIASFFIPRLEKWRKPACALVLTLVVGAGLLTNVLLKGYWGRPRPRQWEACGGKYPYRPFWRPLGPHQEESQKSFPSGHVAMGCYFFSLCLVARRYHSRFLWILGVGCTFLLGGGLMVGRVAQGGHFVSDVLAAALLMWLVALASDWLLFTWGEKPPRVLAPEKLGTSLISLPLQEDAAHKDREGQRCLDPPKPPPSL